MKTYILVGQPNSGKTTLYNWLTGSNYKTVNYPGSTIEYYIGKAKNQNIQFVDTPGTYSLMPRSPDEKVTYEILFESKICSDFEVLLVVDGLQLERQLILAKQLKESLIPFQIIVTMGDLIKSQGQVIKTQEMSDYFKCTVTEFNGQSGLGLDAIIKKLNQESVKCESKKIQWTFLDFQRAKSDIGLQINKWVEGHATKSAIERTRKIDKWLLGPFGLVIFFGIMTLLFSSLFWFSSPFSDGIESFFNLIGGRLETQFPDSFWAEFLSKGLMSSFSAVLVFVPQILFLFLGLGFLESSGYLPRAAALIDHPMKKIGLGGRSFVPLLSGFACAVPAIMATRNISSARDRWVTLFIIPLMSCSARLPVYGLLLSFLYPDKSFLKGLSMAVIYLMAMVIGGLASYVLSTFLPSNKDHFFMMELPIYRKPKWGLLVRQALSKTKSYVLRAGPIIICLAVVLWFALQFPRIENKAPNLGDSYAGQLGQFMEPVFKPMGVDWRVGVGLITAFAAREVFVSSMAVTFKVTEDESKQESELLSAMNQAKWDDGKPIFTWGSVLGLIFFFMVALQCMTTVAMQIRESGSGKFAWGQVVIFNLIAYIGAVAINQTYSFLFQ